MAGIYALTSRQHPADQGEAFMLLRRALRQGYGQNLLARDPDLMPVRQTTKFRRLVEAARLLHGKNERWSRSLTPGQPQYYP